MKHSEELRQLGNGYPPLFFIFFFIVGNLAIPCFPKQRRTAVDLDTFERALRGLFVRRGARAPVLPFQPRGSEGS